LNVTPAARRGTRVTGPRYPTGRRGLVDPQILRDLGDGLAGLGDDPYGPLAELRIELPSLVCLDSQLPLQSRSPRFEGRDTR
jgi:hypothetical protein